MVPQRRVFASAPYTAALCRKGQRSFTNLYVSSYTLTPTALIRARQPGASTSGSEGRRFIAIGQANAVGTSKLHSVGAELANIGRCIDGIATFARIEGQESSISKVAEEPNKNEWVHLVCHGVPNRNQPFESAFALYDGRLTIQQIIGCNLENAEFAYLSVCHTTVGDAKGLDGVVHFASAMQFSKFCSVIGTTWRQTRSRRCFIDI